MIRSDWTTIVLARILKLIGRHRSRALRLVSKQTRDTIDSVYWMAFPSSVPRIFVHGPGITGSRATKVRSILAGPYGSNGTNGPNGRLGPRGATISIKCDAAGPCADETYAIRDYLAAHPNDTVELTVSGDFMIEPVGSRHRAAQLHATCALRSLRDRISKARFTYCILRKWQINILADILPPSLSDLELDRCTFHAPIGPLLDSLSRLVRLGLRCSDSRVARFPTFQSLAKRSDTLHTLDLSGVKSLAHESLTELLTAAKNMRILHVGSALRTVPPTIAHALLASPSLREIHASRCAFTFDILRDACDAISATGQRPAPALEILDLSGNRDIGSVPSAVAFLRAVPSLKEIFLQETGVHVTILSAAPNKKVVFHLSFASLDASWHWFSWQISRARVEWHRYPYDL